MYESTLAKVESQRLQLEDNITELRKSLNYWQTLEIDYEALKEEFSALPTDASRQDFLRASQESGSEILDEKELLSILGGNAYQRTYTKIVDVLTKRIEYVSRNVSTLRKQISSSEKQRDALIPAEDSDQQDGAVFPLTEITEELDENDQVVSAKLETADSSKQYLVDLVNKAGAGGTLDKSYQNTAQDHPPLIEEVAESPKSNSAQDLTISSNNKSVSSEEPPSDDQTFAPPLARELRLDSEQPKVALLEEEIMEVSNDKPDVTQNPDDTEEDAALRQEMLQYGLGEVGAIVAELDLEDFESNEEDDGDGLLAGSDFDEDEESEESEDERGMTKNPIISESYRRRMQELEKKLGMQGTQNLGQKPTLPLEIQEQLDRPKAVEAARKAAIARANAIKPEKASNGESKAVSGGKGNMKEKKKVTFADDLDIAPAKETTVKEGVSGTKKYDQPIVPAMSELIVERSLFGASTKPAPASEPKAPTTRVSRFKAAKTEPLDALVSPEAPHGAHSAGKATETTHRPGKIVAETLVERPFSEKHSLPQPPDLDDLDEELHRRQIAVDYHKMRNRLIQQQGGFIGDGELDNYGEADSPLPVEDEVTGSFKKVSRFKAARMK